MIAAPRPKPASPAKPASQAQTKPKPRSRDKQLDEIKRVFYPSLEPCSDPLGQRLWEIFGHSNWDYIEADNSAPGQRIIWRTETKYPLSPRILFQRHQNPAQLIGVRFDKVTQYGLFDIDALSQYLNFESIRNIRYALETIGIVGTVLLRSSYSNGIHLYLPLPEAVSTFDLAVCLHQTLETHGFEIKPGQLEIFPNIKPYTNGIDTFSRYNGHRLPLQPESGSYLLDQDLNPIGNSLEQFWHHWDWAVEQQSPNDLRSMLSLCRDTQRRQNRHRKSVEKANFNQGRLERWQKSIEALLAEGWSGPGQTNNLLKQIAILGHVHHQLEGPELIDYIETTAQSLPGYRQHCGHQHELSRRAKSWAKHIEKVYWKAGSDPKARPIALECLSNDPELAEELAPLHPNQDRRQSAHERIKLAYTELQSQGAPPATVGELAKLLSQCAQCSLATLYKDYNLPLWHPEHKFEGAAQYGGLDPNQSTDASQTDQTDRQPDRSASPTGQFINTIQDSQPCLSIATDNHGNRDRQPNLDQPNPALDQPVINPSNNETTPLQPSELGLEANEVRSPDPLQDGVLQAAPPLMKYQGVNNGESGSKSDSRKNQISGNGGVRGGAESSYPQAESPKSGLDLLEQELMGLHQEMVEPDLGEPLPSCDIQPEPVIDPRPKPKLKAKINPCQTNTQPEPLKVAKSKPKPKLKLKVNAKSPPEPVPNVKSPSVPMTVRKLTKPQQAQAKEQVEVITPGIQKCVVQLGWSPDQVTKFIQSRFGGRRRSELSHDELVLLLYLLQAKVLEQATPDS